MPAKIFDSISFEEINEQISKEVVLNNYNSYTSSMLNLDHQIRGIQFAIEEMSSLIRIKNILTKQKNKPFNTSSKKLTTLAIEKTISNLQINNIKNISLENIKDEDALQLCVESIKEVIKNIWESIVKTFKYIWEKIKSFFSGSKKRTDDIVSKAKRSETELKDSISEIDRYEVPVLDGALIDSEALLKPLRYLNKNISSNELIELINKTELVGKVLDNTILEIEKLYNSIEMIVKNIPENDREAFRKLCISSTEEGSFSLFETFTIYSQNISNLVVDEKPYKERLNSLQQNGDVVKSDSLKIVSGFINGGAIVTYTLANNNTGRHILKLIDECNNEGSVTINIPDKQNAEMFASKVTSLSYSLSRLCDLHNSKITSLHNILKTIQMGIGIFINNIDEENKDEIDMGLTAFSNINAYLNSLSITISQAFNLYQQTVNHYVDINIYIKNHYKQINESGKT
jgi:hypothetical protein